MKHSVGTLFCFAGACLPSLTASAEEPWRPTTSGPFITYTAPLTPAGRLLVQPLIFYSIVRGAFDADGRYQSAPSTDDSRSMLAQLFVEAGFTGWLAAGMQLALQHNTRTLEGRHAETTGLADGLVFARASLLHGSAKWFVPEVTIIGIAKLPMGRYQGLSPHSLGTEATGNGAWELTLGTDVTAYPRPFVLHLDLLLTAPLPMEVDGVATQYGLMFTWSTSAELPLFRNRFALMAEFSGKYQASRRDRGEIVPSSVVTELLLGIGVEWIASADIQLLLGYQRTLWGRNLPAVDTVAFTLVPTI